MMNMLPSSDKLRYIASVLTFLMVFAHIAFVSAHFRDGWMYPLFLLAVTLLRGIYGLMLLTEPWAYDSSGYERSDASSGADQFYQVGLYGNVLVVLIDVYWHFASAAHIASGPAFNISDVAALIVDGVLIGTLIALRRQATTRAG